MIYKISPLEDLAIITEFVYRKNNIEEHHIAYCSKSRENIRKDYEYMLKGERNLVVTAWSDSKLCGVLGLYCIEGINRMDCVGPFVDYNYINSEEEEKTVFISVAKEMVTFARNEYPAYHFNFNINSKNADCIKLMAVLGSEEQDVELELRLKRENFASKYDKNFAVPFSPAYEEQLRNLHEQTAPDVYLTSNQLIKTIGTEREVFLLIKENQLIAYGVLQFSGSAYEEVCVEIIGVNKNRQGKGYGKMILDHLLCKAFEKESIQDAKLIVDEINTVALNLYESFDFECTLKRHSFILKAGKHKNIRGTFVGHDYNS